MARIRTVKPEFWGDEKLAPMDALTRLVFLGLISMADDAGRLLDSVKQIDGVLFAYTDDTAREPLARLAESGRIRRGETASGQRVIQITNWHHQKVDHPNLKGALPPIAQGVTDAAPSVREVGASDSRGARDSISTSTSTSDLRPTTSVATGAREPSGTTLPAGSAPSPADELASLIGILPPEAIQLLGMFYEPALTEPARARWRQAAMQLIDALTPNHPGPKIRGGTRVKARSVEHMADVCRAVMRDPPMDRDAAVVFVLKKLTDPPKGPSVTEKAKREEQARVQEEETYHLEARAAAIQWAKTHPVEYEPIRAAVEATYKGKSGTFAEAAKASELTQRCAKAAGFPSFDAWRQGPPPEAKSA